MSLITWANYLSVNITEIDNEHQKLIAIINELHDAMRQRRAKEALAITIEGLIDYTKIHFTTEENYFDKFNYPLAKPHKKEHIYFINKIMEFQQGFKEERIFISIEIMEFLRDWLVKHIQGTDKKYISFFHEKGLK